MSLRSHGFRLGLASLALAGFYAVGGSSALAQEEAANQNTDRPDRARRETRQRAEQDQRPGQESDPASVQLERRDRRDRTTEPRTGESRTGQRERANRDQRRRAADQPWLGVFLDDNEDQPGARVSNIFPASPAARAGLRNGDVIVQVNGQNVANPQNLIDVIEQMEPRSEVELTVDRRGQQQTVTARLGTRDRFLFDEQDWGQGDQGDQSYDGFADIPPYAMQMEHDRRNAEQHQRIENEIRLLREEVRQLRQLLEQRQQ